MEAPSKRDNSYTLDSDEACVALMLKQDLFTDGANDEVANVFSLQSGLGRLAITRVNTVPMMDTHGSRSLVAVQSAAFGRVICL